MVEDRRPEAERGEEAASPVPLPKARGHARKWATARRRATELLIVFVGVSSAFLLNRFESDRRDSKRRHQILASLEREARVNIEESTDAIAQNEPLLANFERRLAAGEMPGLGVSMNSSSYSATDDAALLQAGGLELLDIRTIELLRTVNSRQRSMMEARRNQFELSLAELTNHEQAEFYDPATHQLKKRYEWWPYVQRQSINDAKAILAAEKALLTHLQAEQGTLSPAPASAGQTPP